MDTPLVIEEKDPKWELLSKIFDVIRSRRIEKEMAKEGIKPVNMAGTILKIVLMSIFFSVDVSYVVEELNRRKELRRFVNIGKIPEAKAIYRFLSRFDEKQFVNLVSGVLSSICVKRGRNKTILVGSTDISLDLNWFKRTHLHTTSFRLINLKRSLIPPCLPLIRYSFYLTLQIR